MIPLTFIHPVLWSYIFVFGIVHLCYFGSGYLVSRYNVWVTNSSPPFPCSHLSRPALMVDVTCLWRPVHVIYVLWYLVTRPVLLFVEAEARDRSTPAATLLGQGLCFGLVCIIFERLKLQIVEQPRPICTSYRGRGQVAGSICLYAQRY